MAACGYIQCLHGTFQYAGAVDFKESGRIVTENGSEKVYVLDNNELFNVDENTRIILTDAQLEELSTLLGITD